MKIFLFHCTLAYAFSFSFAFPCELPRLFPLKPIVLVDGTVRDPSSPLFTHGLWHIWATVVSKRYHSLGYRGRVHHFYAPALLGPWNTSGEAISPGKNGTFDSMGTFTPSAVVDGKSVVLFYGGVALNDGGRHAEAIGMASASSPFGPWTKSELNPVVKPLNDSWCNGSMARVDEAEPYWIKNQAVLIVKTVCNDFTALPMAFRPTKSQNRSFLPPFSLVQEKPLMPPDGSKGFEQSRVFPGPRGCLHLTAHDHSDENIRHYVSKDGSVMRWQFNGNAKHFGASPYEVTPVWPKGSRPGDDLLGIPQFFIQFIGKKSFFIVLLRADWTHSVSA